jgi:hypothetical protein
MELKHKKAPIRRWGRTNGGRLLLMWHSKGRLQSLYRLIL